MNIVVAIDSFKGSLSSMQANTAVATAAKKAGHKPLCFCVADGGEGTVEALCRDTVSLTVTGPLGEKIEAVYGLTGNTAVIEIAKAAGLTLVPKEKRNPLYTTTYGVGEIIKDAVERGCRKFIIGIGGSATNDGGAGMLMALGCKLINKDGERIPLGAKGLESLRSIDTSSLMPEIKECKLLIACDVNNPLCGENGCSAVFAPQKGADSADIELMDKWLENYADLLGANKNTPGAGAAGGLGFAFLFLGGKLNSGIETVLSQTGIEEHIKEADLVITGEGKIDSQSPMGKTPYGVARLAKKYGKRVIAFCGKKESNTLEFTDEIYEISPKDMPLEKALETAYENLETTAYTVLKGI